MSEPDDPAERHRRRAQAALDLTRWPIAEREARALLAMRPDDVGALLQLSQALGGLHRMEEAAKAAERAVALDPSDSYAHYRVGWCRVHQNDPLSALSALERAVILAPWAGRYHTFLGYALSEALVDEDRQRSLAREGTALSADDEWAHHFAAAVWVGLGEGERAEQHIRRALAVNASDSEHLFLLSLSQSMRGHTDEAERTARASIRDYPLGTGGWIALAESLRRQGRTDEALTAARNGLEHWPSSWEAWDMLVRVHLDRGDTDGARKAVTDALATNDRAPRIRRLRSLVP